MEKPTTVHIISHTHWDREWFLSNTVTSEWLPAFFDSLFAMLEKEPQYRFVLDGQTLMIEDWLEALKRQGKNTAGYLQKLTKYTQERRLLLGPYYMQPDWQLASGESLIRNLLIGGKIARQFAPRMEVGWLLDNFGQISQAVQIHKGFGIKGLLVWRGIEMEPEELRMEFLWESPDGSVLPAIYLLDSYRNAMRLAAYPQLFEKRILNEVEKLKPFTATGHILLMNGYDQEIEPDDILPQIKSVQTEGLILLQSVPEELITAVEKHRSKLPRLKGLQYSGRFVSVFPGTLSSRMYLKILNDKCQRLLEKQSEPLAALRWLFGGKYDQEKMLSLWKLLLQNHLHDSICGVCIDDVHTDMVRRLEKAARQARDIAEEALASFTGLIDTSRMDCGGEAYLVFNPSLTTMETIITIQSEREPGMVIDGDGTVLAFQKTGDSRLHIQIKDTPACGYQAVYLIPPGRHIKGLSGKDTRIEAVRVDEDKRTVENRYFKVQVKDNGSLDVFDKINRCTYRGLAVFEDGADAGDTYNYSPPLKNVSIRSSSQSAEIEILEKGPLRCLIELRIDLNLPEELSEDRKTRCSKFKVLPIVTWISVEAGCPLLRFRTLVKNTVKDHRLRVLFPTGLDTDISHADSQFDVVEHDIDPRPLKDGRLLHKLEHILLGAREPEPTAIFPQGSFVDLSDGEKGVAMLNRGLPEYEILSTNNTVALTLFRSVGWLARSDLLTRTGDAGPHIYTPEAQCLCEMEFNYALYFHQSDWIRGKVHRQAEHFNSNFPVIKTDPHPGILPDKYGLLELDSASDILRVTALKRSEDGRDLIIRCYNPSKKTVKGKLISKLTITCASYTDLRERVVKRINVAKKKRLTFTAKPKQIVTLKLVIQKNNLLDKEPASVFHQIFRSEEFEGATDFSGYPSMPIATEGDIVKEEHRVEVITEKLKHLCYIAEKIEEELEKTQSNEKGRSKADLQKAKAEVATFERTLLESKLSLILLKKKYSELNAGSSTAVDEECETMCREIGFKLNMARIKKRTYDYFSTQVQPS